MLLPELRHRDILMSLKFLLSMGGQSFVDTYYYNNTCEYILSQIHEWFQKVKYLRHLQMSFVLTLFLFHPVAPQIQCVRPMVSALFVGQS